MGHNRLEWIDWMNIIGIYLVVLGHFYSVGEKFIYVFHVPLFFLISGFLSKKESDNSLFWRKLWYNLAVPMLIMTILYFVIHSIKELLTGDFHLVDIYWFIRNVVFGMVSGFDALWFVYTLILLKIILQYSCSSKLFYSYTFVMLILAYFYNRIDLSGMPFFFSEPNAFVNVCTAFPFFALGVYVHDFRAVFDEWKNKLMLVLFLIGGLLLTACCYLYNDYVALYCCHYGNSMILFLLGGLAGSVMIFAVSKLAGSAPNPIVILSQGTIIILGFHKLFIDLMKEIFPASVGDAVQAALIVLIFVPLIVLIGKYFPLIAGKYRIN